jgi:acyl-coenzyme A thioesterase PaaI-like protein
MWARLFINKDGYLKPFLAKLFANYYLPYLGAAIRLTEVSPDYRHIRVEMPLTFYNRNYVGTQFGGALYSMTDPIYMLMLMNILGRDYVVWDKAANIEFVSPGKSRVVADFNLTEDDIASVKKKTESGEKYFFEKEVLINDSEGSLVARVRKTVYIRKKQSKN